MNEHVHVCAGLERLACFFDQRLETRKMCFICMCAAACRVIVPNVEDTIGWLIQDEVPASLPEDIGPLFPREPRHVHNGKRLLQKVGKVHILHVKCRAEQIIFAGESLINICLVQLRFGCNGFGGGFLHAIPRYDANCAVYEDLPHLLYFQLHTSFCKISGYLSCPGKESRTSARAD